MVTSTRRLIKAAGSGEGHYYRPGLDVLRFCAFLLVLSAHFLPDRGRLLESVRECGALGVPVFFVLSAFLITELLTREKKATGSIALKAFYIRRILRIWPLYFAALGVAFISSRYFGSSRMTFGALLSYVFLAGNWNAFFSGGLPLGFGVLWSVGVEEQFYVVWPAVLAIGTRKVLLPLCSLLWAVSQFSVIVLCMRHSSFNHTWYNSLVHLQYFVEGAMLSLVLQGRPSRIKSSARPFLIIAGVALLLVCGFAFHGRLVPTLRGEFPAYLLAGAASLLMLLGFLEINVHERNVLPYWGKVSYGLYIVHSPILVFASLFARSSSSNVLLIRVLAIPVVFLSAHLSYRYFEKPFLRLKERFEIIRSRPA